MLNTKQTAGLQCEWSGTEGVYESPDGLLVYQQEEGAPLKTIVPPSLQIPLVERQHKAMHVPRRIAKGVHRIKTVLPLETHA